jgi:hypothetical protein
MVKPAKQTIEIVRRRIHFTTREEGWSFIIAYNIILIEGRQIIYGKLHVKGDQRTTASSKKYSD